MNYFATKRAQNLKGGVAMPSQRRYVHYFDQILKREVYPSLSNVKVCLLFC